MCKHEMVNYRIKEVKEKQLKALDLRSCGLTRIPDEVFELKDLQELYLSNNQLKELPKNISLLKNSRLLDLSANKITELHEGILKLKSLQVLRLIDNQLKKLPNGISQLKNLRYLDLSKNQLEELPSEISQLKKLRCLYLKNNQLKVLPDEFTQLDSLIHLDLEDNQLEIPPPEIARRGLHAIRNYFKELEEQGEEFIYEAKLVLVGEPGAGKTSLAEKLLDPEYELDPREEMTKGIDVHRWYFPYNDNIGFRVNIWDFGGQVIMHATHRYFLTKRSLYLVLADNRKEDTDFYYWLNLLKLLSEESPILIVLNEKFEYRKYIPSNILETFSCVKKAFNINLADNTGLSALSNSIQQALISLPHIGKEPIPKKWVYIRKILEEEKRDYISKEDYFEICRKHDINDEKKALCISEFLHDLGVILHFQKDRILCNTVILNTRWATEAVYLVLFDKKVVDGAGEFDMNDLKRIWASPEYKERHPDLLQLMINFELCYEIDKSQKFIIPELLPEKSPEITYFRNLKPIEIMHFEYRYNFMPKGIIARLIVKLHKYIYNRLQWKNGVVLQIDNAVVEIVENFYHRVMKIRIIGTDKREALAIIRKEIKEVHSSFENLEVGEMIPCKCEGCTSHEIPHFYQYDLLKRYEQNGRDKIVCDISLKDVPIHSLISDIIIPHIREAEYYKFMEDCNYKTEVRGKKKVFISYSHFDSPWLKRVQKHFKALENENIEIDVWDDTQIKAGKKWEKEIGNAIIEAKIAVLLISTDFLASDFITRNELPPLLEAAETDGAVIIPLILKPSRFTRNKNLSQFQAINDPKKPLINLSEGEQEEILVKLTETIEEHLK